MKKLTQWYPPEIKPVREGVYQIDLPEIPSRACFQHWNGEWWGAMRYSASDAYEFRSEISFFQNDPWRGLAEQPK